jgi:hypothetical protein
MGKKRKLGRIRKNLTRFQVRKALGNPHEVDQSIKPRVDQIYIYSGDLDADGKEEGKVETFFVTAWFLSKAPFDHSAQLHFPKFTDGNLWRTFDIDKFSSII